MTYPELYAQASSLFPDTLVDTVLPWLMRGLVQRIAFDGLDEHGIQVIDPEFPEEPVIMAQDGQCPACTDAEALCVHVVAVAMYTLLGEPARPPDLPQVPPHEPHSFTIKGMSPQGYEGLLCLRDRNVSRLLQSMAEAQATWAAQGWTGAYNRSLPHPTPSPLPPTPEPAKDTDAGLDPSPKPVQAPAPRPSGAPQRLVFHAERLEASFLAGKWYWAVFGPDMPHNRMKHGIRIWDEGLTSGGLSPQTLDKERPPSLQGYLAEYILKPDGTPDKVVRLVREA